MNSLPEHGWDRTLDPDTHYYIRGSALNELHAHAVERFNEAVADHDPSQPSNSTQSFWNGYGCAIQGLRNMLVDWPLPDIRYKDTFHTPVGEGDQRLLDA